MSDHDSAPGQDSFLDIVANLVGILIILVVIVGAQAATVWKGGSDSDDRSAELNQIEKETELREQEARSVQLENVELNEKIEYQQRINENLSRNRHMLLVQVESKKKLLEHKKLELGNEKSLVLELESKIESTKQKIEPLFQAKCQGCHQPAKPLGDYVMTSFDKLLAGGETGDAAIVPGKPDESYLIGQITPVDGVAEMPKNGDPLSDDEVALVRKWIEQGAHDDTRLRRKLFTAPTTRQSMCVRLW